MKLLLVLALAGVCLAVSQPGPTEPEEGQGPANATTQDPGVATMEESTAESSEGDEPADALAKDFEIIRPDRCPRSTFERSCSQVNGNCMMDSDCRDGSACCDQWGCGVGRCTRILSGLPRYDWQINRPEICYKSSKPPPMPCQEFDKTCDYDWECSRQDGRAASCCDQWGCNIGRCTNSFEREEPQQ